MCGLEACPVQVSAVRLPCDDVLAAAQSPRSPQDQSDVARMGACSACPVCVRAGVTRLLWVVQALQPGRVPAPAPAPGVHGEAALPARLRHPLPVPHVRALRRPPLQEPCHP